MMVFAWLFASMAIILLLIAAFGLLSLPNALSRQHAATKATMLSISLFIIGLVGFVFASDLGWEWITRLLLLLLVLLITLPLASHALARSAVFEQDE